MSQTTDRVRWTTADLELFPDNGNRYEIIDGELLVTPALHFRHPEAVNRLKHQRVADRICSALNAWSNQTRLGEAVTSAGIIFTDADNVIPDVIWVSKARLEAVIDEAGHLTAAPELVVEVLSPGSENERRDKQLKLKLYAAQGIREYWIADRHLQQIQVYRRQQATLVLAATLLATDELTSPLLPGFTCLVEHLFT